ncbi:hypothetical protein L1049_017367 [Liquidambar formosana]|uniref:BED-type domain-containing protein n=1 Tax=Liquidambar formosana TaxID=63359 RepID=A0AAP0S3K7_LIQFO
MDTPAGDISEKVVDDTPTNHAVIEGNSSPNVSNKKSKKATGSRKRSVAWNHFKEIKTKDGKAMVAYNYCGKKYACNSRQNGTTSMLAHIASQCTQYALNRDKKQSILGFRPVKTELGVEGGEQLVACTFSVEACKKAFAEMIIIDELPFNFAVKEGFRRFMHVAQPKLTLPSRTTVAKDCLNIYYNEKKNLNSNNTCIEFVKKKTKSRKGTILEHEFLHMRCCAHILNLIACDGLKDIDDSMMKVRNAVRYLRSSPSRMAKFKNCAEKEAIECKGQVCLDVPTRWNSTYLMLERAPQFQKAFERLEEEDTFFLTKFREEDSDDDGDERVNVGKKISGPPDVDD